MNQTYGDIVRKRWYRTTKRFCKRAKRKNLELNLQILEKGRLRRGEWGIGVSYNTELRLQTKEDSLLVDYLVHYTPPLPEQVDEFKLIYSMLDLNKAVEITEYLSDKHNAKININKKSIDEAILDHDNLIDKYKQQGYKDTFRKLSAKI